MASLAPVVAAAAPEAAAVAAPEAAAVAPEAASGGSDLSDMSNKMSDSKGGDKKGKQPDDGGDKKEKDAMLELGESLVKFAQNMAGSMNKGADSGSSPMSMLESSGGKEDFASLDEGKGAEAGQGAELVNEETLEAGAKLAMGAM